MIGTLPMKSTHSDQSGSISNFFYFIGKFEIWNPLSKLQVDHVFRDLFIFAA